MGSTAGRYLAGGFIGACAMETAYFLYEENFGVNSIETGDYSPHFRVPTLYVDIWETDLEDRPPSLFIPMAADNTRVARPSASGCDLLQPRAAPGAPIPTAAEEQHCTTYLTPLYDRCFRQDGFQEKIDRRLFEHPLAQNRRAIETVTNVLTFQACYAVLSEANQTEQRRFASRILTQLILVHSQGDLAKRLLEAPSPSSQIAD
jgi:hypothetical protein